MKSLYYVLAFVIFYNGFAQNKAKVQAFLPEVFIDYPNVRDFTISADEDEAYFTMQSLKGELSVIATLRKLDGKWSTEIVSFSGIFTDLEPFLSPDELRLYFVSNRPIDATTELKDFDIWYVERDHRNESWSEAINLGPIVNTENDEYYPAVSTSKTLYFTRADPNSNSKDDIIVSLWKDGSYTKPRVLGEAVNSDGYEFNAFISPDDDLIIFGGYMRPDGVGDGDLYLSRKDENGQWMQAENLGVPINSKHLDYCPFLNLKTKTLYFTSKRTNVNKHNSGFANFEDLLKEINQIENGTSRIYKADFSAFLSDKH